MKNESILAVIVAFGVVQILLMIWIHCTTPGRQTDNQCDCHCTMKYYIDGGDAKSKLPNNQQLQDKVARIVRKSTPLPINTTEQEVREPVKTNSALELPKEETSDGKKAANESEVQIKEDSEYNSQHKIGKQEGNATQKQYESLIPGDLNIDTKINASGFNCTGETGNILIIYVYTAPSHLMQRERVRNTYGSVKEYGGIKIQWLFFVGGLSDRDKRNTSQYYDSIVNESRQYGDMVLDGGYIDTYRNLILKGISALKWISKYCPYNYRVLKVDDDTVVNPYNLIDFLKGQSDITMSEIICKVTEGSKPMRNPKHKHYLPVEEYEEDTFPPYCQGYGYIIPPKAIPRLIFAMKHSPPISMEDVYLTGITAQYAGIRLHHLTRWSATSTLDFDKFLERVSTRAKLFFVGHIQEERYAHMFWLIVEKRHILRQSSIKAGKIQEEKLHVEIKEKKQRKKKSKKQLKLKLSE